ncbi:hypothetical protein CWE09_03635 [Aliidiomarina minuta]|uniref:tRNA-modifying protein YgfZ-like beta-barrel domain-containing protein n=1 Tax=Aliidiomarina minuta TaxID=880057 RepID=A0A432W6X8_9GAMM|nr:hypothetical protein [Aliidiomarina minuta]RUO25833.1 hypothetical protein CWE09_03635 [Aliidiomarina minuta]
MSLPIRHASQQQELTCTTQLGAIRVSGEDCHKFMQGQLTCDIDQLQENQWVFGGHCDAQGKLWSVFRAAWMNGDLLLIQPLSSIDASLQQLKKFAVFSKVDITDASQHLSFKLQLQPGKTSSTPSVKTEKQRLILNLTNAQLEVSEQPQKADYGSEYWLAYEIEQGVPLIGPPLTTEFIPQMVNLDKLGGINFKKGCYIGQETIARMHYRGKNNRELRQLTGKSEQIPATGVQLERAIGDSWRRAGAVLNAVRYDNGEIALLAVLPVSIENDATLRIKGEENSTLTLCPPFDNQELSDE